FSGPELCCSPSRVEEIGFSPVENSEGSDVKLFIVLSCYGISDYDETVPAGLACGTDWNNIRRMVFQTFAGGRTFRPCEVLNVSGAPQGNRRRRGTSRHGHGNNGVAADPDHFL